MSTIKTILGLVFLCLFLDSVNAADDFVIKDFQVNSEMRPGGGFTVEERIAVYFNEKRRGLIRTIPYVYKVEGQRYQIRIKDLKSESHKDKVTREGGEYKLRMGRADKYVTGLQTYLITYYVSNALMDRSEDEVEFFWNLTGNDWDVTIEKASYKIQFPSQVNITEDNLRLYSGPYLSLIHI